MESARPSTRVTVREVWERSTSSSCPSNESPDTLFSPPRARCQGSYVLLLVFLNEMEGANSPYRADTAAKRYAAAALLAVAIYNAIEMMPIIYFTFSRFSGLYFWSMVTAVTGVMFNAIGFGTFSLNDAATPSLLLFDKPGPTVHGLISLCHNMFFRNCLRPRRAWTMADPTALQY